MWHPESYGRRQGAFKAHSRGIALSFKAMDTLALRLAAAEVRVGAPSAARVDLGTHFGLAIEGATDVPGRDEECLLLDAPGDLPLTALTHRVLLQRADWTAPILRSLITPLLQGEHIHL